MHDLRPAAHEMARLVNGVRDDQLGDPTPCPSYALGDLLQHVRGLAEAFTLAARKEQPPGGSKPPPPGDASRLPDDWRGETAGWLDRLVDAWADPAAWEGTTWIAGFEAPSSAVGITAANELVAHGWDVARASGQRLSLDDASLAPRSSSLLLWRRRIRRERQRGPGALPGSGRSNPRSWAAEVNGIAIVTAATTAEEASRAGSDGS